MFFLSPTSYIQNSWMSFHSIFWIGCRLKCSTTVETSIIFIYCWNHDILVSELDKFMQSIWQLQDSWLDSSYFAVRIWLHTKIEFNITQANLVAFKENWVCFEASNKFLLYLEYIEKKKVFSCVFFLIFQNGPFHYIISKVLKRENLSSLCRLCWFHNILQMFDDSTINVIVWKSNLDWVYNDNNEMCK